MDENGKKTPVVHPPIVTIIDAMSPLMRAAFELAAKEADQEYALAKGVGYVTDGGVLSKMRNELTKPYYVGSLSVTHYKLFKLFFPLEENDLGQVMNWPTLSQCLEHWETMPPGMRRYMTSPAAEGPPLAA